jgi:pimeloyl-ACP methyl ester carboxylesterase
MPVLSRHCRVLAFDQRGHARGLSCAGSFRLEDCADDVAAVTAVLGIDRVVAVGYSMGGLIAQLVWRRHPKLIAGLVLCATAHNLAGAARDRFSALVMPALILRAMAAANGWLSIAPWLRADLLGTHLLDTDSEPAGQAWALQQMRRTPLGSALAAVSAVYGFSSADWIGDVTVPTAVIITRRDRVVSPTRQEQLATALPSALTYELDGDHGVFLSAPERLAAMLHVACQAACAKDVDVSTGMSYS